ncbi:MAG: acetyl-CoA carboxylase carboxyltransferase subunit alpha [Fusobacteriota bacterium]
MFKYLEFEKEIENIDDKIKELKAFSESSNIDLKLEMDKLEDTKKEKLKKLYKNLTPWQRLKTARHPSRPYTLDYIENIVDDFIELHGDRLYKDDLALVGGLGKINGQRVMIIGNQKGRDIAENLDRNFGMSNPEGYRKALRLMKMANKFGVPVVNLIDTPGAYPGIEAEENGQGEAIARNLMKMSGFDVPLISIIIGEGGSGGALGLGVTDKIYMLENSWYSVISPEGCAAILYDSADQADQAAKDLKIDPKSLKKIGIVDEIIKEPLGGAHRDTKTTAENLKAMILKGLKELKKLDSETLKQKRYDRYRNYGEFEE